MAAKKNSKTSKIRPMSNEHKAALAEGRTQGRAVRHYLEALEATKPKRGRKRTTESITKRLTAIDAELNGADPLKRLQLTQEQINLQAALEATEDTVDITELERGFIAAAGPYASRKGLTYAAFRAVGVPPTVLSQAGIRRGA